jgi:group I intron endonuclease
MQNQTKRHYLYRIHCTKNQKNYIGQSKNPSARWRDHRNASAKDNPPQIIHRSIKKHGNENFEFEVIASGTLPCTCEPGKSGPCQDDANEMETLLVQLWESHISTGKGYNVTLGGQNAPKTEEWKAQMSKIFKGRPMSEEQKAKISATLKGRPLTEETKKKMSEVRQNMPLEQRQKISAALMGHAPNIGMTGKHQSEEARRKISEWNTGRKHSDETKNKISESSKNRIWTEERKVKQSNIYKGRSWKLVDGKRVWMDKEDE